MPDFVNQIVQYQIPIGVDRDEAWRTWMEWYLATGIDVGRVKNQDGSLAEVEFQNPNSPIVLRLWLLTNHLLPLSEKEANKKLTAKVIRKRKLILPKTKKLTIGSDPEFVFFSPIDNSFIPAEEIYQPRNPFGADFGHDGETCLGEIRPHFSKDPLEHIENIKKILDKAKKTYPRAFELIMKVDGTTGGHVHFGHPKIKGGRTKESRINAYGQQAILNFNLNYLLSIPLMFLENSHEARHRKGDRGYGNFSDYRPQVWGMEYRTPGSWLASEKLATGTICLAYALGSATLDNGYLLPYLKIFSPNSPLDINSDFRGHDVRNFHKYLKPLFNEIVQLPYYLKYKKEINPLFDAIKKKQKLFDTEIKWGWRINFKGIDNFNLLPLDKTTYKLATTLIVPLPQNISLFDLFDSNQYDYRIQELFEKLCFAFGKTFNKKQLEGAEGVRLYGIKEKRGNTSIISTTLSASDRERLVRIIDKLRPLFPKNSRIQVHASDTDTIGFSREMRRKNLLACSAVTIALALLINPSLYRYSLVDKKTGRIKKTKSSYLQLAEPLLKVLRGRKEPFEPLPTADSGENRQFKIDTEVIRRLNTAPLTRGRRLSRINLVKIIGELERLTRATNHERTSSASLDQIRAWRSWMKRPEIADLRKALDRSVGSKRKEETKHFEELTPAQLAGNLRELDHFISYYFSQAYNHFRRLFNEPNREGQGIGGHRMYSPRLMEEAERLVDEADDEDEGLVPDFQRDFQRDIQRASERLTSED